MRYRTSRGRRPSDSAIPLINIVFLMLIFFLFAGTIARDDAREIAPPESITQDEAVRSTGAVVIAADGRMTRDGASIDLDAFLAELGSGGHIETDPSDPDDDGATRPLRIAADKALPVATLKPILEQISQTGVQNVVLITQRAGP